MILIFPFWLWPTVVFIYFTPFRRLQNLVKGEGVVVGVCIYFRSSSCLWPVCKYVFSCIHDLQPLICFCTLIIPDSNYLTGSIFLNTNPLWPKVSVMCWSLPWVSWWHMHAHCKIRWWCHLTWVRPTDRTLRHTLGSTWTWRLSCCDMSEHKNSHWTQYTHSTHTQTLPQLYQSCNFKGSKVKTWEGERSKVKKKGEKKVKGENLSLLPLSQPSSSIQTGDSRTVFVSF